jgi:hypothetical protein
MNTTVIYCSIFILENAGTVVNYRCIFIVLTPAYCSLILKTYHCAWGDQAFQPYSSFFLDLIKKTRGRERERERERKRERGATTSSITTFSITPLEIMSLFVPLSLNDLHHNRTMCHLLSFTFLSNAECLYAECHYAECHYDECHYAECHYAECHYAECHYAECHYAKCHYAGCRGAQRECFVGRV